LTVILCIALYGAEEYVDWATPSLGKS